MKFKLSEQIITPDDLLSITNELRNYAKWYDHNAVKLKVLKSKDTNNVDLSSEAQDLLKQWIGSKPIDSKAIHSLISELEVQFTKVPKIRIVLPAVPSKGVKLSLSNWCRTNLSPDAIVDFKYNSLLLGGMVVYSGSRIFDWSFRRQILNDKDKLKEVITRV